MDDSGGYTMKWRRVNPKPWTVRCNSTVFGLGQENSSSVGCCAAGEPAKLLHSEDSFWERGPEISPLSASPAGEQNSTPVNVRGRARPLHMLCQHVAYVNSQWPRVKSVGSSFGSAGRTFGRDY